MAIQNFPVAIRASFGSVALPGEMTGWKPAETLSKLPLTAFRLVKTRSMRGVRCCASDIAMRTLFGWLALAALTVNAVPAPSPTEPAASAPAPSVTARPVQTLNYQGFTPAIWPPDGGCIIVARLYKEDGKLNVHDSAPVCEPESAPPQTSVYVSSDHPLGDIKKDDIIWAAYGWVFPEDKSADYTGGISCVWPDADLSKPCLAEHELKPSTIKFPNPLKISWESFHWITHREIWQTVECPNDMPGCKLV